MRWRCILQVLKRIIDGSDIVTGVAVVDPVKARELMAWLANNGGRYELVEEDTIQFRCANGYLGPYNLACGEGMANIVFRGPDWHDAVLSPSITYYDYKYTECRYQEECDRDGVEHESECDEDDGNDCGCECYCSYCEGGDGRCLAHHLLH